jgi:hypothetical protein
MFGQSGWKKERVKSASADLLRIGKNLKKSVPLRDDLILKLKSAEEQKQQQSRSNTLV